MKTTTNSTFVSAEAYHDAISERARHLWHEHGKPIGKDVEIWIQAERELLHDGLIPPAPPPRQQNAIRGKMAADDIDVGQLQSRLNEFGSASVRSPTSVTPSTQ